MRVSYSSLESFKQCPLRYKFSQIDKIKEPKSKEAIFGSYIHKILKWFYQQDPTFPSLEKLLGYYKEHWPQKTEGFSWNDKKEEKFYFQEGERMLRDYYKNNTPLSSSIVDLETHFEVVINEKDDQSDKVHILSGIIDRIDKLPNGMIEIIDYKTGKRMPSQRQVDKNNQLSLYAIGLRNRWPNLSLDNLSLSLYFLKFGEKIKTTRKEEDLKEAYSNIIDLIHKIQNSHFEPHPSPLCAWCGYRNICPVWRHLYEKHNENNLKDIDIRKKIDEYFTLQKEKDVIENKLQEIKNIIDVYSRQKGLEQVFGKDGYFKRDKYRKVFYEPEEIRAILEPLGKWEQVLEVNNRKLNRILREVPPEIRDTVKRMQHIEEENTYIATYKKPKKDIEEEMS